ncbi:MAG: hypothetical protein IMY72_09625 [Bacteroidetes bacterium]|nr:hypothetical protein [Bacteroidota bacterium]
MMNRKIERILLVFILLIFVSFRGFSQSITVKASVDTNLILIGDQIKLHFELTQPNNFQVNFPNFNDTIIDKIEILERLNIDTVIVNNNLLLLKQDYLITCFDSGIYEIPEFKFAFKSNNDTLSDTISTRSFYIGVQTMKIDTAQANAIADIKLPIEAPITINEALPYILYALAIIVFVLLVIYLIRKRKKHEPILKKKIKPKEPANVIALRDLDKIKHEKYWQKGKVKYFHSIVTDVLRTYIENRFDINAMEKTSQEIISEFTNSNLLEKKSFEKLKQILSLADFVKFAKLNPLIDENEASLNNAYEFVNKTKKVVEIDNPEKDKENEKTEIINDKNKKVV